MGSSRKHKSFQRFLVQPAHVFTDRRADLLVLERLGRYLVYEDPYTHVVEGFVAGGNVDHRYDIDGAAFEAVPCALLTQDGLQSAYESIRQQVEKLAVFPTQHD